MADLREVVARALLDRRGFGFYTDPMEGGQDAYDITNEALAEADAVLAALAGRIAPEVDGDVVEAAIAEGRRRWAFDDGAEVSVEQWHRDLVEAAAPLIAAATERRVREECAKIIEPKGPRPCDCERCDCMNIGDAEAVAAWDERNANAAAIRTGAAS